MRLDLRNTQPLIRVRRQYPLDQVPRPRRNMRRELELGEDDFVDEFGEAFVVEGEI
jgi:hypothetical protein